MQRRLCRRRPFVSRAALALAASASFAALASTVGCAATDPAGGDHAEHTTHQLDRYAASFGEQDRFAGARPASVIFIHPDGASAATWAVSRALEVGPDGELAWDKLPHIALYRGHMADSLTATSNGGATTHTYGVKVAPDAYGRTAGGERGRPIVDAAGQSLSVARQAVEAGIPVGLVQTGTSTEPGTGVFLADAASRRMHDDIAAQLLESGARVLFGGGERYFLPEGLPGVYGPGARDDGRNLLDEARDKGYTVIRTRDELRNLPDDADKVLGLFASYHTFNDESEETLRRRGLPLYNTEAPTVAEMTRAAIDVLSRGGERFFLVVEEEGTDNFGNNNNAAGTLEAARRADAAIAEARDHLSRNPDTLIITTADSDAGGMRLIGIPLLPGETVPDRLPATDANGAPMDGVDGARTAPFFAAPDQFGRRLPFAVVWAARDDVSGAILVRAEGANAQFVAGSMDNTGVARLMRRTLLGDDAPQLPR